MKIVAPKVYALTETEIRQLVLETSVAYHMPIRLGHGGVVAEASRAKKLGECLERLDKRADADNHSAVVKYGNARWIAERLRDAIRDYFAQDEVNADVIAQMSELNTAFSLLPWEIS